MRRYFHDIAIAVEAIFSNKMKSVLTALGIIFGVAAVISMLEVQKRIAEETNVAFWNMFETMGGEASARPYPGMQFSDRDGTTYTWHKYDSPYTDRLELDLVYPEINLAVAYAYCTIDAPAGKLTKALVGTSDGVSIF
mgnify:CR=1 FL=1